MEVSNQLHTPAALLQVTQSHYGHGGEEKNSHPLGPWSSSP